jgi:hypothetical protein
VVQIDKLDLNDGKDMYQFDEYSQSTSPISTIVSIDKTRIIV